MKKLTGILALFLCLVFFVSAFASCGKNTGSTTAPEATEPDATASQTTASQTTENVTAAPTTPKETTAIPTTTDPFEVIGDEVSAFSADDRNLKIQYNMYVSAENIPRNNIYIQGPDEVTMGVTSQVEQLVYERNHAAADLLGLTLTYDYWDDLKWGAQAGRIKTQVSGHDPEAPDLYIDMLYDLNKAMKTTSVFKDLWSIPGSYFDFDAEGWMTDWMNSLSFTGDRAYILGSDYFIDIFRAMGVLPLNMTLMDANSDKLAAFITTETLQPGEKLTEYFFDFVDDGKWTWSVLGQLCEAIWIDTDGNQTNSISDTLGIVTDRYTGLPASLIVYSSGVSLIDQYFIEDTESEYYGKQWMAYKPEVTSLADIFDAVAGVFNGRGAFVTNDTSQIGATEDNPGLPYHYIKFAKNELLFAGPVLLGALEDVSFQTMESAFSVVPLPKVSADGIYNTVIHNTADCGAINVNTTPGKARALSAYLQYCSTKSGEIREEFLEIVTKYRTTTYNQGTDRMLDLIYASVITGRDKALEDVSEETSGKTGASWMKGSGFTGGSAFVVEKYQSELSNKQKKLDNIMKIWYNLPTSETENAE